MDHASLTVDVDEVEGCAVARPALPALEPVPGGPPVRTARPEPVVPLEGSGLACLSAYVRHGLEGTTTSTFVREQVAERLHAVAAGLPAGLSLAVFDAWRSRLLQRVLLEYARGIGAADYVSAISDDPSAPPPHLTGGAVDLTLTLGGQPLALGTAFDEFTPKAHTAAFEDSPGNVRDYRRLLYWAMRNQGFVVHELEWWHFEFGTRRWAALTGQEPLYGPWEPQL